MRAHLHLLSKHRRESGEERAVDAPPREPLRSPFRTGLPSARDIPAICRCQRHRFDLTVPAHNTAWLAQSVARQRLSMVRGSARICVARLEGRLDAAAVFRVTDIDARWQLDLLATRDGDDDRAVDAALRRAVQDAGSSGTRRLFARMPADVAYDRALRRAGFLPYMSEHILQFQGNADSVRADLRMVRRIHPADVWSVHQLYLELVPRQVQYADAMTSRAWDGSQPLRPGTRRASGWVLEDRGHIRAFARVSTREHAGVARLDILIAPDVRHAARSVIAAAVGEVQMLHGVPCAVVVPGYQGELIRILQEMDFVDVGTQTAFVCYTTVSSRAQVLAVDPWSQVEVQPRPVTAPGLGTAGVSVATFGDHLADSGRDVLSWRDGV